MSKINNDTKKYSKNVAVLSTIAIMLMALGSVPMMKSYAFDFEHPNGLSAFEPSSLLGCFGVGVDCNRSLA